MNAKLEAIAQKAAADLIAAIREGEDKILDAWHAAEEDAQENDTKPKFKLGFGITLDLDADSMESKLTFGIKHNLSVIGQIPDPNQPSLIEPDEPTITIKTEGVEPVTMTAKQFSKAADKLSKN